MEDSTAFACALANFLVKDRPLTELLILQTLLQIIGAVVNSAIVMAKAKEK